MSSGALTADTFTTSNFGSSVPSHGSQVAQKFIIKSASGVAYTADTCATLCYTHAYAPLPCHFYVLDGTTCKLGNFLQSTSETMGNADATIYLSESERARMGKSLPTYLFMTNCFQSLCTRRI